MRGWKCGFVKLGDILGTGIITRTFPIVPSALLLSIQVAVARLGARTSPFDLLALERAFRFRVGSCRVFMQVALDSGAADSEKYAGPDLGLFTWASRLSGNLDDSSSSHDTAPL